MVFNKTLLITDMKKIPRLILAFVIIGYGIAQTKALNFGMAPWDTLVLGIVNKNFNKDSYYLIKIK